jgi:hypothetical protein
MGDYRCRAQHCMLDESARYYPICCVPAYRLRLSGPLSWESAYQNAQPHIDLGPSGRATSPTKWLNADRLSSKWQVPSKLLLLRPLQYGQPEMGHCL